MFVGETGLGRIVKRTLEVMKELGSDDPAAVRAHGAIDLPTAAEIPEFLVLARRSTCSAPRSRRTRRRIFASGIKGRPDEAQYEDHVCAKPTLELETPEGAQQVPMRNAMNEVMRESYIKDCEIGLKRWNRQIERAGLGLRLTLPSPRFRRSIGAWANAAGRPGGQCCSRRRVRAAAARLDPVRRADRAFVRSADAARRRARQDGRLDRAARPRHQQPAGRIRVREAAMKPAPPPIRYRPRTLKSEGRLERLIAERLLPGADQAVIDRRIWDLFGERWAMMFTDLSGFSRRVAEFGIIHFLQTIHESFQLHAPVIDRRTTASSSRSRPTA